MRAPLSTCPGGRRHGRPRADRSRSRPRVWPRTPRSTDAPSSPSHAQPVLQRADRRRGDRGARCAADHRHEQRDGLLLRLGLPTTDVSLDRPARGRAASVTTIPSRTTPTVSTSRSRATSPTTTQTAPSCSWTRAPTTSCSCSSSSARHPTRSTSRRRSRASRSRGCRGWPASRCRPSRASSRALVPRRMRSWRRSSRPRSPASPVDVEIDVGRRHPGPDRSHRHRSARTPCSSSRTPSPREGKTIDDMSMAFASFATEDCVRWHHRRPPQGRGHRRVPG